MLMVLLSRVYLEQLWRGARPLRALSRGRVGHLEPHVPRIILEGPGTRLSPCSAPTTATQAAIQGHAGADGFGGPRSGHTVRPGLEGETVQNSIIDFLWEPLFSPK